MIATAMLVNLLEQRTVTVKPSSLPLFKFSSPILVLSAPPGGLVVLGGTTTCICSKLPLSVAKYLKWAGNKAILSIISALLVTTPLQGPSSFAPLLTPSTRLVFISLTLLLLSSLYCGLQMMDAHVAPLPLPIHPLLLL